MPEIKNTFTQGKMNKDLDERIIPNGQYRDALNVKVSVSDDSNVGTVQNILGNERIESVVPPDYNCVGAISDEKTNKLYWFVTKENTKDAIIQYDSITTETKLVIVDTKQNTLKFTGKIITGINIIDNLLFFTDNVNEPKKINIDSCIAGTTTTGLVNAVHTKLIVDGVDKGDIEESHITVIRKNPKSKLGVKINKPTSQTSTKLFEKIFPRFSYRYKYQDGEYSAFGPFTDVVFTANYVGDYSLEDAYSPVESYNTAMVNRIKSVELTNFVDNNTPKDVVQVEILYKQEGSNVVFSIKKINYNTDDWNNNSCLIKSESIYAAIPEDQLLRPFDAVPTKALAQEITGNRLIYGNYTQGHDMVNYAGNEVSAQYFSVDYQIKNSIKSFSEGGIPSLKSQRKYQVGFVLGDKYGRETPVFTSDDGFVEVPWFNYEKPDIGLSFNNALQIVTTPGLALNSPFAAPPSWAEYYKYYIKETSSEYYNLIMDKAYVPSRINVFDNEEDHVWISFPSSDRSKVTEEDYLILKRLVGAGEQDVNLENKFKVLAIDNEAPDQIKFEYVNLGVATQSLAGSSAFLTTALMTNAENRIDQETDTIQINLTAWNDDCKGGALLDTHEFPSGSPGEIIKSVDDIFMSFSNYVSLNNVQVSEKYKAISVYYDGTSYRIKLDRPITLKDAQLADIGNEANNTNSLLKSTIRFKLERKVKKDLDEFSGKFFAKIVASRVAVDNIENAGQPDLLSQFTVSVARPIRWYVDTESTDANNIDHTTGLINAQYPSVLDSPSNHDKLSGINGNLVLTNTATAWAAVMTENSGYAGANYDGSSRTFFIDNAYFAAGQVDNSNYARKSGQTWKGSNFRVSRNALNLPWDSNNTDGFTQLTQFTTNTGDEPLDVTAYPSGGVPTLSALPTLNRLNANLMINGLEGYIQATDTSHIGGTGLLTGHRVWMEGDFAGVALPQGMRIGLGPDFQNYNPSTSYGSVAGKHYLHISFLAPGVDLHSGTSAMSGVTTTANASDDVVGKGPGTLSDNLQGIWGGGYFGVNTTSYGKRVLVMEGNYDNSGDPLLNKPGPGVGQGYNQAYTEQFENQWNPAYPESEDPDGFIRDFVNNLKKGSKFKFSNDTNNTIIQIVSDVVVKKLYNHTPWRAMFEHDTNASAVTEQNVTNSQYTGDSVEEAAWTYLEDTTSTTNLDALKSKIVDFGKRNNRRVTYIFEIDKDINGLLTDNDLLDSDGDGSSPLVNIEFLSKDPNVLIGQIKDVPAVWETEPKIDEGLDIYYEASGAYPFKVNENTNELLAPVGSRVEILNFEQARNGGLVITETIYVQEWTGARSVLLTSGFNSQDSSGSTIDYTAKQIRFFRDDGSFVTLKISGTGDNPPGKILNFNIQGTIDAGLQQGLSWSNCFSFGNGIESDRVRDDFNAPQLSNGVKASTTIEGDYKEENRKNGLIFSGIYNSTSGVNNLNQFLQAQNITKDLNPTYGSIQKLFQRRISLVAFCEDRVVSITSNKDSLFNADGNPQLISSTNVLGDATPFVGDYGISKNPESFAKESYRAYFTDKQRGAVLRLSMDGLTPISEAGMADYFRDSLKVSGDLIGSYDNHNKYYNLTLKPSSSSVNLITNGNLSVGSEAVPGDFLELITDGEVNNITPLQLPTSLTADNNSIINNRILNSDTTIINHAEVPQYSLVAETTSLGTTQVVGNTTFAYNSSSYYSVSTSGANPFNHAVGGVGNYDAVNLSGSNFSQNQDTYTYPTYDGSGEPVNQMSHSGEWYSESYSSAGTLPTVQNRHSGDIFWNRLAFSYQGGFNGGGSTSGNPWFYGDSGNNRPYIGFIVDGSDQGLCLPGYRDADGNANTLFLKNNITTVYPNARDNTIFNGEEIVVVFYARNVANINSQGVTGNATRAVKIELYDGIPGDGGVALSNSIIIDPSNPPSGLTDVNYTTPQGGDYTGTYTNGYTFQESYDNGGTALTFGDMTTFSLIYHSARWKFNDGTEDEGIVVQNLQFKVTLLDTSTGSFLNGGKPFGHIGSFAMRKQHELTEAYEEFTPITGDGNGIPSVTIPAFAEVKHSVPDWLFTEANGDFVYGTTSFDEDFESDYILQSSNAVATYGPSHLPVIVTQLRQGTTKTLLLPPNSEITGSTNSFTDTGNGAISLYSDPTNGYDNGTVNYWDGTGTAGAGQQPDGTYSDWPDDSVYQTSESYNASGTLTTPFVDGNWYVVDIVYDSNTFVNSGNPLPNQSFVLTNPFIDDSLQIDPTTFATRQFNFMTVDDFYASPTDVFRVYFKYSDVAYGTTNNASTVTFVKPDDIQINILEINVIDVTAGPTGGTAVDWTINVDPNEQPPVNYFYTPPIYVDSSNGFVFTDLADQNNSDYIQQIFSDPISANSSGYRLSFEIKNYTTGTLNVRLSDEADANGNSNFIDYSMSANGTYTADFNFDGNGGDIVYDDGINAPTTNSLNTGIGTFFTNQIYFQPSPVFVGTLDNISLLDLTPVFTSGGSFNSFTTSGFDPLLNNYIDYDATNEEIVFNSAPAITSPVQLEQPIFANLSTGDSYKLTFDYDFSGEITVYYFNSSGDGFIDTIQTGTGTHNVTYDISDPLQLTIPAFANIQNALVIAVTNLDNDPIYDTLTGSIDNISLQKVIVDGISATISYSEKVRGWVSFKSFILEQGVSLSNNYYTFKGGGAYKHDSEAVERTVFYNEDPAGSYITAILNEAPSVVKNFNTLNYEGSQAKITALNNYNYAVDVDGWSIDYIKTDKQEGSVKEFLEKEGKWFNYIRGKTTVDTSALTFQGLGIAKTIV